MVDEKFLIIYHKEDNDGLFSMAIFYNYIINELNKNAVIDIEGHDYISIAEKYSIDEDIHELFNNYNYVIMVDLSFSNSSLFKIINNEYKNQFIWIDHHYPIILKSVNENFDKIQGIRDIHNSALYNVYKYCYPFNNIPNIFNILSGWDSFSYERLGYKLDFVRNVNVGVNIIYKLKSDNIIKFVNDVIYNYTEEIIEKNIVTFYDIGKRINDYEDEKYKEQINNYGDFNWLVNGEPAIMIMYQGPSSSLMFKEYIDTKYKRGIVLKYTGKDNWVLSLYNINNDDNTFHCGNYLREKYNGGGHEGAAGCTILAKNFMKLLTSKTV